MNVGVSKVLEENKLHQNDLVAVVSFLGNISSLFIGDVPHNIIDLEWIVNDEPVKESACEVNNHTLSLNQGEGKVVLVVTIDTVKVIISIVLVENCIDQNLYWGQEDHECKVVHLCVGD